jgi:hypothetical protein
MDGRYNDQAMLLGTKLTVCVVHCVCPLRFTRQYQNKHFIQQTVVLHCEDGRR